MHATVGDQLIIHGARVDQPDREAEIIDVRGQDGEPPFFVRWSDNGHEALVYPGPHAFVRHLHDEAQPAQ
jgi:Domain of unknown function (DUF1918)